MRCAGSKPYDLVAIKNRYAVLVECKNFEGQLNSLIKKLYLESGNMNNPILLVQNTSQGIKGYYIVREHKQGDDNIISLINEIMNVELWD
jgi:hypothetical protein